MIKLLNSLKVGNELGEGVIWDHARQRVWWTDIEGKKLYRYEPEDGALETWSTPERLACFAPVQGQNHLIAAFESGFAFYDPETSMLEWIKKIEADNPGTRLNDGRTDRQGRFWAGSMVEDRQNASYKGSLYSVDSKLNVQKHVTGLSITNSLCWSPDADIMYHCNTPKQTIQAYPFDALTGQPGTPNTIITTAEGCYPDGSCVDANGYLWNAQWAGKKVVRYQPSGDVNLELEIPASQPTCVAFGGRNLNLLFVTTAWQGMDEDRRAKEPGAGDFYIFETDFTGLQDAEFVDQT